MFAMTQNHIDYQGMTRHLLWHNSELLISCVDCVLMVVNVNVNVNQIIFFKLFILIILAFLT